MKLANGSDLAVLLDFVLTPIEMLYVFKELCYPMNLSVIHDLWQCEVSKEHLEVWTNLQYQLVSDARKKLALV